MAQFSPGPEMPAKEPPEPDPGYGPDINAAMEETSQAMDEAMQVQYPLQMQQQYIFDAMHMPDYLAPGQMGPM